MRFNPPPNWPPAPPGWTPSPDWQPDPSWPPIPPGWPLWVAEPPTRRKAGLIIGAIAAVLLIGVGVVVAIIATRDSPNVTVTGSTTTTQVAQSDEDQLRDVVDQFEKAWNDEDYDELSELMCAEMRNDDEFGESEFREMRDVGGQLTLTINSIDINGDAATATILNSGEDADDIGFVREDDEWKWCEF
ncbi:MULTISPECIES: hypothetical protein [unclassified Mycobacterium]|uniref:Rv0361 family membrane protein n=1 Tax=unclassified Mycobacterium TaxID=2642494 RepID=UPI0029C7D506|nr:MULTISPECIES: hypothetical protein [unclassified Mycobacterium]